MYRNRKYRGAGAGRLSTVSESLAASSQSTNKSAAGEAVAAGAPIGAGLSVLTVSSGSSGKENYGDGGQQASRSTTSQMLVSAKIHRATSHLAAAEPLHNADEELFTIPASQVTTQSRYVSQRSMLCRTQQTTQFGGSTSSTSNRMGRNYCERILVQCGVSYECAECFVLDIDHIGFVSRLRRRLRNDADYPANIAEFLAGLEDDMRTPSTLAKLLGGCKVVLANSDQPKLTPDSLVQDFLMLEFMQRQLQQLLFAKLRVFASETDGASLTLVQLLLAQLRLVDQQRDGEGVLASVLAVLAVASAEAKRMIVASLEDIVDITLHDRVMVRLLELFPADSDLLTVATVETFANLSLSARNRRELRRRIVVYMRQHPDVTVAAFPQFVQFLLQLSPAEEADALPQVVIDLRTALRWPAPAETRRAAQRAEVSCSQRGTFDAICSALIKSRKLFDCWLRVVANAMQAAGLEEEEADTADGEAEKAAQECDKSTRAMDLLVLLAMQSINDDKRNYIENIIRRKIKDNQLRAEHIELLATGFPHILQQYDKVLLEMLNAFFRDKDASLARLANRAYRVLFSLDGWDRKLIVTRLVGFVCHDDRRKPEDGGGGGVTTAALLALTEINGAYPAQMQNNGNQLLRILDHIDDMSLQQVRLFMDLLCCVAYPQDASENASELREHLDMLVRKQVSSAFDKTRKQGIVGAARLIDHMIWTSAATATEPPLDADSEATFGSIDDIPDAIAQSAARYIELIRSVARHCPASLALAYDELAALVSPRSPRNRIAQMRCNAAFIAWLCDLVTEDFQDYFVAVDVPPAAEQRGLQLDYLFCINGHEDNASASSEVEKIAINIGGCVLQLQQSAGCKNAAASVAVLGALFNLMRSLHAHRNGGDLEPINAVLGCAIVGPKCVSREADADPLSVRDEFGDGAKAAMAVDMLVYMVNWMRETVSAFASQESTMIRKKVVLRVGRLVQLEQMVRVQLRQLGPVYQMPSLVQFAAGSKQQSTVAAEFKRPADVPAAKRGGKRKATGRAGSSAESSSEADETADLTVLTALRSNTSTNSATTAAGEKGAADKRTVYGAREVYRPLDPDIMLLLREELHCGLRLPAAEMAGTALTLPEFEFVLADLVAKVEGTLGVGRKTADSSAATSISAADLCSDLLQFLPRLLTFLRQMTQHLHAIVTKADEESSKQAKYSVEANYTKAGVAHILRLLAAIYAWPEWMTVAESGSTAMREMLLASLQAIAASAEPPAASDEDVTVAAIRALSVHQAGIVDLATAGHLVRLVETLARLHEASASAAGAAPANSHQFAVQLCKHFLGRRWFAADGCAERGAKCNALLDELVRGLLVRVKLQSLVVVVGRVLADVRRWTGKDSVLSMYPTIMKSNFPLLYRALCAALLATLQRRLAKNTPSIGHLRLWEEASEVCNQLLAIIEAVNIPRNFALFLKYAHQFVRAFLQHGLPMLEQCFRTHANRVREIIRCLQNTTRFLHRLCCHSKSIQNGAIVAQIPALRETVEALLVRVKALLVANKCCTADIWEIGNLKNKDLQGQVLAQLDDTGDADGEDESAVIPERVDEEDDDLGLEDTVSEAGRTKAKTSSTAPRSKKLRRLRNTALDDDGGDGEECDDVSVNSKNSSRSRVF